MTLTKEIDELKYRVLRLGVILKSLKVCESNKYEVFKRLVKYREWRAGPDQILVSRSLYVYFIKARIDQLEIPLEIQSSWDCLAINSDESFAFSNENTLSWKRQWVTGMVNTGALGARPSLKTQEISLNMADKSGSRPKIFFSNKIILSNRFGPEQITFADEGFSLTWDLPKNSLEISLPKDILHIPVTS